jgi:hypothetical protein
LIFDKQPCYYIKFIIKKSTFIYIQMLLSRKRLNRIKKTKQQSRKRRKRRNKKKYKKRKRAGSRRKRRALNLRKRTMKSYRGGYNKENLSFLVPYFNESEGKQDLYLVTHKLLDISGRNAVKERNIVVNLLLKGQEHRDRAAGVLSHTNTGILLEEMYKSIINSGRRDGPVNRFFSSKKIVLEGEAQDILGRLTIGDITDLNKKLLDEQIVGTGFGSSSGMLDEVKSKLNLMASFLIARERRENPSETPTATIGSKESDLPQGPEKQPEECPDGTTRHPEDKTKRDGSPVCLTDEQLGRYNSRHAAAAEKEPETITQGIFEEECPEGTTRHPDNKTKRDGSPVCLTDEQLARYNERNQPLAPVPGPSEDTDNITGGIFDTAEVDAQKQDEPEVAYEEDFEDPCEGVKCDPGEKCVEGDCVEDGYDGPEDGFVPEDQLVPFNPDISTRDVIERLKELGELCGPLSGECKDGLVCRNKDMSGEGTCIKEAFTEQPTQPEAKREPDEETPTLPANICQVDEDCGPGGKCNDVGECVRNPTSIDFTREIKSIFPYIDSPEYNPNTIIQLIKMIDANGRINPIEVMQIALHNIPTDADLDLIFGCLNIVLKLFYSHQSGGPSVGALHTFNNDPVIQQIKSTHTELQNLSNVINILRELQTQALGGNIRSDNPISMNPPTVFLPVFMTYTIELFKEYREIYPDPLDFRERIISDRSTAQEKLANMRTPFTDNEHKSTHGIAHDIFMDFTQHTYSHEKAILEEFIRRTEGSEDSTVGQKQDSLVVSPTGPSGTGPEGEIIPEPSGTGPSGTGPEGEIISDSSGSDEGQKVVSSTGPQGGEQKQNNLLDHIGTITTLPIPPSGFTERVIVIERLVVLAESGLQTPTYRVVSKERDGIAPQVVKSITQALQEQGYIRKADTTSLTATTFNPYPSMIGNLNSYKPEGAQFLVIGPAKATKGNTGSVRQYLIAKAPHQLDYTNEMFFNQVTQYCQDISDRETEVMVNHQLPAAPTGDVERKYEGPEGGTGPQVDSSTGPEGGTGPQVDSSTGPEGGTGPQVSSLTGPQGGTGGQQPGEIGGLGQKTDGTGSSRGQAQAGPTGPTGPTGPGGPTGGTGQRNLPNDPLKYSQPKFTATWQVYPGMYQPGLRVMADTGMGTAEWLRHLGQPNPLPIIQQAVAPGTKEGENRAGDEEELDGERNTSRGGGKKKKRKSKKRKSMKKRKRKGRKSLKRKN